MNPILIPPLRSRQDVPQDHGSGRYYARLSQIERLSERPGELYPAIWILEAFDEVWFEANPFPESPDRIADYYARAQLFVLEVKVPMPGHWRLDGLGPLYAADTSEDDAEPENWFIIQGAPVGRRTLVENELLMTIYSNLYLAGIPATLVQAGPTSLETSVRLNRVISTAHIPDATEQQVDIALEEASEESIEWVVAYDVGQGNAIGLCEPEGTVKAYFDLGGGVIGNAKTFPTALTQFCFTQQPPIILSHWDFDHWSSGNRDQRSHKMTWLAPRQSVGPTHVALMMSIRSSGGTLLLVPSGFPAKWRGQLYLECCTGNGRNHSGLALTLSEKPKGVGQQMLFPGDARYSCLPSFPPNQDYLSVVAPHHGADMRDRSIPSCSGRASSRLVYSFGLGNTFNHPRAITRQLHHAAGWHDPHITQGALHYEVRETTNRGSNPLGHVFLGWSTPAVAPPLPCSGSSCQLQAQQL